MSWSRVSTSFEAAEKQWCSCHNVQKGAVGPAVAIFSDEDPSTTTKGCGFKDAESARRTLWLTAQPGSRYKRYWTIRAMLERAQRHPHFGQNSGMQEAASVFSAWMEARKRGERDPLIEGSLAGYASEQLLHEAERSQQAVFRRCRANSASMRNLKGYDESELAKVQRETRMSAVRALRDGASVAQAALARSRALPALVLSDWPAASHRRSFPMKATELVAMFGSPGEHGYGYHECSIAAAKGLPRFLCCCRGEAFSANHRVVVFEDAEHLDVCGMRFRARAGVACLALGKQFPFDSFTVDFDGGAEQATFVQGSARGAAGNRQPSLFAFVKRSADASTGRATGGCEPPAKLRNFGGSMDARVTGVIELPSDSD